MKFSIDYMRSHVLKITIFIDLQTLFGNGIVSVVLRVIEPPYDITMTLI